MQGRFKGSQGAAAPCESLPPVAPKVNDAGILLNYVVIASNVYM